MSDVVLLTDRCRNRQLDGWIDVKLLQLVKLVRLDALIKLVQLVIFIALVKLVRWLVQLVS